MKRKTKHRGAIPTEYAEVKVNHGIFEDYLQYGHNMIPSTIVLSYPAKRSLSHGRDWGN